MAKESVARAAIEWGVTSRTRTLVALNNKKNLESAINHLEHNGYELSIVHDVGSLIKQLTIHRPHAVLLSWNLKNTDVRRLYHILTEKFKLVCVVFAEDSQPRTNASLMASGISQCLLAPVRGGTAHARIQAIIARELKRKKKTHLKIADPVMEEVPSEKVPSDLRWQKTSAPTTYGGVLWRGDSPDGKDSKIHFFRGPFAPVYDSGKREWTNTKGGKFYFKEEPDELTLGNVTSEKQLSPLDKTFDWDAALQEAREDLQTIVKLPPEHLQSTETKKADLDLGKERTLAGCLRRSVDSHVKVKYPPVREQATVSRMSVCGLKSDNHCGYLVCVNSKNLFLTDYLSSLIERVKIELFEIGENLNFSTPVLEVEVNDLPFLPWAGTKADFSMVSEENGLAFAFFSTIDLPQILTSDKKSLIGVKVEMDLTPNTILPFDLYLHLPLNEKYLLYVFRGSILTETMYEKFMTFGMSIVYIKKTDKDKFLTYCAQNFIEASI